jgi:FkbM family methyltransferase
MLERFRDYASEMAFAAKVPYGLKSKLLLAIKTIHFHLRNLRKRDCEYGGEFSIDLRLGSSKFTIVLRPGAGDLFILYEIFLRDTYSIPASFCEPSRVRTIVDCGANIGLASLYLAERYPNAHVYAIEPHPDNFKLLCANVASQKRITPIQACIAGDLSKRKFITLDAPAWGNQTNSRGAGIEVPAATIDAVMENFGIDFIDVLKIDIEGAESEVFMNPTFLPRVGIIVIELHGSYNIDKFQQDLSRWSFTAQKPNFSTGKKMITATGPRTRA